MSDDVAVPSVPVLTGRMQDALDRLLAVVGPDDEALARPGPDGWSAADHLFHLAAWVDGVTALLRGQPRHEAMGVQAHTYAEEDEDAMNAEILARSRGRPETEARTAIREAHERLVAVLHGLDDSDLHRGYSSFLPDEPGEETGRPVVAWVIDNTYDHYDEHGPLIARAMGEKG